MKNDALIGALVLQDGFEIKRIQMPAKLYSERETIAHHEAAHAVMAIEVGDGLLDVGIDLDRVDATGGIGNVGCRLFVADLDNVTPSDLEFEQRRLAGRIDCSGTVLAAGAASDAKLRGQDPWTALQKQHGDYEHMLDLLRRAKLDTTPELETERLHAQLDLAVEALQDPLVWKTVEAVAQAALDRNILTGLEIVAIAKPKLEPEAGASS